MTIEALIKAVPPPSAPTYAFDGPWEPIEAQIGTPLPQDYKDLVRLYGDGWFLDYLDVFTPSSASSEGRLIPQVYEVQRFFLEFSPHLPMYPKPGGLLVCGSSNNGEYIFWLTRGPVSEWPIVVWDHEGMEGEELELFECDLTDFIAGLVRGDIRTKCSPEDLGLLEREEEAFKSWPDPWVDPSSPE